MIVRTKEMCSLVESNCQNGWRSEIGYKLSGVSNPINPEYTHKKVKYTVKTFCASHNEGTYIVLVKEHALVIKNGIVIDNSNYQFDGYRRPVNAYVKVS